MGFKYFLLMVASGVLLAFSTFCTNNNKKINDNNLFICGQTSPQWFKDEIQKISENSGLFKPIKVFLINDEDVEYIAIEDHGKNSCTNLKVFLCTGIQILPDEEKYATVVKKYKNNDAKIIWPD